MKKWQGWGVVKRTHICLTLQKEGAVENKDLWEGMTLLKAIYLFI